jgi:hypothetical protein
MHKVHIQWILLRESYLNTLLKIANAAKLWNISLFHQVIGSLQYIQQ